MLHVHRSERADPLAAALAQVLSEPLPDPFAREIVAVPTRGMERWLTQQLSHTLGARPGRGDGVAAAIDFPFPERLVGSALARASGIDPDADPWLAERLVWPLLHVTERALEEEWLAPLAVHLREPARERRFARLQRLARLFSRYAVERPQMVIDWLDGGECAQAVGAWQPELLRRLQAELDVPNPARRLDAACARLRDQPGLVDLPPRLAVFGLTRLPQARLRVLEALAAQRDVHLMTLHPSPAIWDGGAAGNRLLASWGRESAAMGQILSGHHSTHHPVAVTDPAPGPADALQDAAKPLSAPRTVLGRIQDDIRTDRPAPGPPLGTEEDRRLTLDRDDQSIRIHACHGRARQVEVMREAILHRLQDDPQLQPRDVIIMCPNVEEFAPLIEAAFEGGELAVRIADRSVRETNPVLAVISRLLDFPTGRVTASEVLDLADSEPVRRRFGFRDDDLAQLREWVADTEIHWGLSARGREQFKLSEIDAGTWAAGLKRLMLTVALDADEGLYAGALPTAEVESGTITLAGRVAELAGRLHSAVQALSGPQSVTEWARALGAAADALTMTAPDSSWQRREIDRLLDDIVASSTGGPNTAASSAPATAAPTPPLSLAEIRALLGDRLQGRPTRANFRTGKLTVCTLAPMRSIPHRVVCLLGLDDGVFPRVGRRDGDDVLALDPQPGDRDPRAEDRQLLLDALLAAQDALIITYTGNDERTNAPRPPAVPVGELLDTIDATTADNARERVLIHHPLQSFDPRNFTADARSLAGDGGAWSFDRIALEGADALGNERVSEPPFLPAPLPPAPAAEILTLDDLVRFAERPVRAFMRQRLGISLVRSEEEVSDALPVELDPLSKWAVGQRLLEALSAGVDGREACLAELARGTLPPGQMARAVIDEVFPRAQRLALTARTFGGGDEARSVEANIILGDGTRLTGTVAGVRGTVLLAVSYSRLNPRHRIAAWVRLLALCAAHPEVPFEAVTIARARSGGQTAVEVARVTALGADAAARRATALAELEALVALRALGLTEPLPLPPDTAYAYAQAQASGEEPVVAALELWNDRWARFGRIEGEREKDENPVALGPELDIARLGELAPRLWQPLLERERVERA